MGGRPRLDLSATRLAPGHGQPGGIEATAVARDQERRRREVATAGGAAPATSSSRRGYFGDARLIWRVSAPAASSLDLAASLSTSPLKDEVWMILLNWAR
jgi:hypothetical protein